MNAGPPGPHLETARLLLRPPRLEDFDAWAECAADPAATVFLGGPQPRALAWRAFMTMAGSWALKGFAMFSVIDKASGRWIGRVGPWQPEGWPGNEIGWGLAHAAEGRGYAYEAAVAAADWAFTTLGWDSMIHCIAEGNVRSIALAERLGSQCRGSALLPLAKPVETQVYGQTREEWFAGAAARAAARRA